MGGLSCGADRGLVGRGVGCSGQDEDVDVDVGSNVCMYALGLV